MRNCLPLGLQGLVGPLEVISDKLSKAWGTVSHLKVGPHYGFARIFTSTHTLLHPTD
jgi:hypothetical protein